MKKLFLLLLLVACFINAQSYSVKGYIYDSESKKSLSFASVRISGTNWGTSSNFDGHFLLKSYAGKQTLIFSYIGYKTDSISITVPTSLSYEIGLEAQAVTLPEVVVTDEDPAYSIIREAIKRKRENRKGLSNFDYKVYSKKIITSAGELAAVEETFLKGYNKLGNWQKEFIESYHKTENMKNQTNLMDFSDNDKYYIDFSTDTLSIAQSLVYLPIADNALDYYDYKLLRTTVADFGEVYTIQVIPKSQIQPLLEGEITIESNRYALNSVNLKSNKGLRFPFVNDLEIKYVQQLGLYENYWLPEYVEMKAGLSVNISGLLGIGKMEFEQFSSITDYHINGEIPGSVKIAVKSKYGYFTADTSGHEPKPLELSRVKIDSLRQIPLTLKEIDAYSELDSSKTLQKMIKVEGALAGLIPDEDIEPDTTTSIFDYATSTLFNYGYFRNNRVTGLTFGAHYNDKLFSNRLNLNTYLAYSLKREKAEGKIFIEYSPKKFFLSGFEAGYFNKTQQWQMFSPYPYILNSAGVTLGLDDQFNYYLSEGYQFGIIKNWGNDFIIKFSYKSEKQSSQPESKYQSIFMSNRTPKINPNILEGTDRKILLHITLGQNPMDIQLMPQNGLVAQAEFSTPSINSDFKYSRFRITGMLKAKTFYDELFISPYIQFFVDAALISGTYGPQHIFTPNSAYWVYSPIGVFKGIKPYKYIGTKMIALHVEHNWRTVPFQAIGADFLADLHLDVITGISGLKMWNNSSYCKNQDLSKPYWEVYVGISRVLAMFRTDVFYNAENVFGVRASIGIVL